MSLDRALGLADGAAVAPSIDRYRRPPTAEDYVRGRRDRRRRAAAGKRLDIQGLRAVAVLAVVVNHLTSHPVGGFLGVDVFFVISGFLITQHLIRERARSGSISLVDFYRRRIRRLFPAALTVIAATIVAAWVIFPADRVRQTLDDSVWAALFSANWRMIRVGTNYFSSEGPESPLQHYWSLSVEEQFYVVWPVVLIVVTAVAARRWDSARPRWIAGLVAAAGLATASLVYAAAETSSNSVVAYFSTFTRGWELGLGAVLAFVVPLARAGRAVLTAMSCLGTALIAVSFFLIDSDGIPFPGAILPCVGAGLIIAAASPNAYAVNPVLTNRVAVYVGDISYSVYVVHFPVIVFAAALSQERHLGWYLSVAFILAGLSVLLFAGIENPVRLSNWLRPRRETGENVRERFRPARPVVLGATAAVLGLALYTVTAPEPEVPAAVLAAVAAVDADTTAPAADGGSGAASLPTPELDTLQGELVDALSATSWPQLDPPVGSEPAEELGACATTFLPADQCTRGDAAATHSIYLVGDSTSAAYTTSFTSFIDQLPGWKVRAAGGFGCAFANTTLADGDENNFAGACPDRLAKLVPEIEAAQPDLLVVTNVIGTQPYTSATQAEIAKVAASVGKVVILPAPPQTTDPSTCYASGPASCIVPIGDNYRTQWLANWGRVAASFGGVMIDPTSWYSVGGYCPAFAGTAVMHKNPNHQTTTYAAHVAPVVLEAFRNAGLLPTA